VTLFPGASISLPFQFGCCFASCCLALFALVAVAVGGVAVVAVSGSGGAVVLCLLLSPWHCSWIGIVIVIWAASLLVLHVNCFTFGLASTRIGLDCRGGARSMELREWRAETTTRNSISFN